MPQTIHRSGNAVSCDDGYSCGEGSVTIEFTDPNGVWIALLYAPSPWNIFAALGPLEGSPAVGFSFHSESAANAIYLCVGEVEVTFSMEPLTAAEAYFSLYVDRESLTGDGSGCTDLSVRGYA